MILSKLIKLQVWKFSQIQLSVTFVNIYLCNAIKSNRTLLMTIPTRNIFCFGTYAILKRLVLVTFFSAMLPFAQLS